MGNDRYHLRHVIGSGGMSEVYEAEDTVLGRTVAVKMLRPEMARDVNFRERFRREAQNSSRLNYPNIVSVFDTGEKDVNGLTIPYIVMELVNGRTLRDIVREDGPLPSQEAAQILAPVADALQASHEAGIIHRDIKPANIMLTGTGQVKVMDFGIARALDDSTSAMTQTSAVIGTAQYLSPEQARGKPADARSDVYALGCVMYEAVTGRTPFEGETPFAVAYQHVQEDPVPPTQYVDVQHLTDTQRLNIDAVILTAMAKHPADRYQSAWEMGEDLRRMGNGQLTEAARGHVTVEDHPTAMVAPVADASVGQHRAPVKSTRPSEDDEGGNGLKWLALFLAGLLVAIMGYFAWDFWQSSREESRIEQQQREDAAARANMVVVPKVEKRPRNEVVAELEKMGLLVTVNEEANPDIDRNKVIRINPAPGSELQKGSSVTLTVSSGDEITDVPDLSGMTLEEAGKALSDAGLSLNDKIEETNDDAPAGQIVSQNPAGGSQLSKGSKVKVTVSKGKEEAQVPDVTGMPQARAVSMLESVGFKVNVNVVDSQEPEDRVVSVINQGRKLAKGETVTIEVSNGMLITAPDLLHKTPSEAESALRSAGWQGSVRTGPVVPTGALVDNGRVGWASVNSGDLIRKNATVELRVWEFNASALLPR
ncbi:Stk1 family PASTA domain-containing Ser/Thr kinase [Corynebacterium striatum]|nr:Stk1 family PASTA domain-containing Ser/Thr kinase [Corynebacterium striatum]HAT1321062.1 Stk1 family PASTA domain-containing Ser/Thr kinase [Corynebacterium striatum]HAT1419688.1 Stk1 family PASTA domain-containing Ser/Thr kinase [Corynebacterium striatum]HAT6643130.1 Stk1 family PASTA domain-containing Ser/Thr kinase [Corynebacterium striatum]HCG2913032.1 Stk1 family PASTA domain-containing Ser/Thr kinase [Corynebacterium striatum]